MNAPGGIIRRAARIRAVGFAVVAALVLFAPTRPARAGVEVVEDEVVFTLHAPKAKNVFLVGDFNNWNPTVEPLDREGNTFTVSLFLVEGTYHYKFVVDGRWIVDPDNPGPTDKGSLVRLVERAGGMALSTTPPAAQGAAPARAVRPTARYIGQFRFDGDHEDTRQIADLFVGFERERLGGRIDLQSFDRTWQWGNGPEADIEVGRVRVDTDLGPIRMRAFESDSAWTSRGPVTLVGGDGIWNYNAGFDRHGAAAWLDLSEAIHLRALYADHVVRADGGAPQAVLPAAAVAPVGADTSAYAASPSTAGADQGAIDFAVDGTGFSFGYVMRIDRGLHPGVLADVTHADSTLHGTVYRTRERHDVSLWWLRLRPLWDVEVTAGYGRGASEAMLLASGDLDGIPVGAVTSGVAGGPGGGLVRILESNRAVVDLERAFGAWTARAGWDWTSFDVDSRLYPKATARVHRVALGLSTERDRWHARVRGRATLADYGDAPAALHVDSPALNPWLYGRDQLWPADIAALGYDDYTDVALDAGWRAAGDSAAARVGLTGVRARAGAMGRRLLESIALFEARLTVAAALGHGVYASADGRSASYDRPEFGAKETFLSGWIECGVRRGPLDVNIGYGFDPVVFDPVTNLYADIGREEFLRQAIAGGVSRDEAVATGRRLIAREQALEAVNTIKVECVVRF